jgi:hypothetical protein
MRLSIFALALSIAFAASAQTGAPAGLGVPPPAPGSAVVMVVEDGGLDPATVRTVRSLAQAALRQRGVVVLDDKRFEAVQLPDDKIKLALRELGATKIYALQMGRLGQKLILTLQEQGAERLDPIYSASLAVGAVEETDAALPKLVSAVLERRSPADNANVIPYEGPPRRKRNGLLIGIVGLTFGFTSSDTKTYTKPFGINGTLGYELGQWRVDLTGYAESHGSGSTGFLGMGATYALLGGETSPYVSAALGYAALGGSGVPGSSTSTADASNSGLGLSVGGGIEFLRLHNFHAIVGAEILVPAFDTKALHLSLPFATLLHLRVGFN